MKKRLIIHIGMHKTGSSSIQETLHRIRTINGYYYFDLGPSNQSVALYTLFSEKPHPSLINLGRNSSEIDNLKEATRKQIIEQINYTNKNTYIMSGECLTGLSEESALKMKNFFDNFFEVIEIYAYIRPPKSYIESAVQEVIKGGANSLIFENQYPKYRNRFEKYDKVFGKTNVKLIKFDPKNFKNNSVVFDFCERIGMSIQARDVINTNISLSCEAISLLYVYRKYGRIDIKGHEMVKLNQSIVNILREIKGEKLRVSNDLLNEILNERIEDIHWMETRLGSSLLERSNVTFETIRNENDLFKCSKKALVKLSMLANHKNLSEDIEHLGPKKIAKIIHQLLTSINGELSKINLKD